jgi:hypothetical protein
MKTFRRLCIACIALGLVAHAQTVDVTPVPTAERAPEAKIKAQALQAPQPAKSLLGDSRHPSMEIKQPARNDMTITESYSSIERSAEEIGANYNFAALDKDLSEALKDHNTGQSEKLRSEARERALQICISFLLEAVLTCLMLKVMLSLIGARGSIATIVGISIVVALIGAILEYAFFISLLNPIRLGLGFVSLAVMLHLLTGLRKWPITLGVTLATRVVVLALTWLTLTGLAALEF